MLNGYTLNGATLNGEILNTEFIASGVGLLLAIEQSVAVIASGLLLSIDQRIEFHATGGGNLLSIDQNISAYGGGNLLSISQLVINVSQNSFYIRNNWHPYITVGSYQITMPMLTGAIEINRTENDAGQMTFLTQWPASVPVDLNLFEGQRVVCDVYQNGVMRRVFTGIVNNVEIDLILRHIKCTCLEQRREMILQNPGTVQAIGYYDPAVSGVASDLAEELDKRLSTAPFAVNVDVNGLLLVNNMQPTAPVFTLGNGDIYRDPTEGGTIDPKITKLIRTRAVNYVSVNVTYSYQRLMHMALNYEWDWDADVCQLIIEGLSLCQRSTIQSAAQGAGWLLTAPIVFEPPPESGFYNCSGGVVAFTTTSVSGLTVKNLLDSQGNIVKDSAGNPVQTIDNKGATYTDSRPLLATHANWSAANRWVQNMTENYTLIVSAPQSINQYGVNQSAISLSYADDTDNSAWEKFTTYSPAPANFSSSGNLHYFDNSGKRSVFNNAMLIALNTASTMIYKAHRDNHVQITTPFRPEFDMWNTLAINTTIIQATGKLYSLRHLMDITTGEAYTVSDIALSRAVGSVSPTGVYIPAVPQYVPPTPIGANFGQQLRSHYGESPPTNGSGSGFYGNKVTSQSAINFGILGTTVTKTNIQEQFIVKTPAIDAVYRNNYTKSLGFNYTISIPNNTFTCNMIDK